jgi:hypothetical protein
MKRSDIISFFIDKFKYKTYLEIGVDRGLTFNDIKIDSKISVDPGDGRYSYAKSTYKVTSDEFFENICKEKRFDIIFIDGLHHSDQVDKDIKNSLNVLNLNGMILLDDVNPLQEEYQIVPRQKGGYWNGDVWKSIVQYRNESNSFGCVSYQVDENITFSFIKETIQSNFSSQVPSELTYSWFNENRKDALGLMDDFRSIQ